MKNVYFIEGGFQSAVQEFQSKKKVTIKHGEHPHAGDCIREGIEGQLFFTGLAWSQNKESITKEAQAYTGCKKKDIQFE